MQREIDDLRNKLLHSIQMQQDRAKDFRSKSTNQADDQLITVEDKVSATRLYCSGLDMTAWENGSIL